MEIEPRVDQPIEQVSQPEQVDQPTEQMQEETQDTGSHIRSNAIFLTGVDELHTNDIEQYMVKVYNKPFQIEWIDDSSLNIVYDDPEDAFQSLVSMTSPEEFDAPEPIAAEQLRNCKSMQNKPDVLLKARFSTENDRKENGSRAKSRYYLFHGEPSRKEDLVRFGTKRTARPMKYGERGRDIIENPRKNRRADDLFPEKAPSVPLDDDLMGDLLPHLAKKPRRGRNRRRNNNKDLPDLFADKVKTIGSSQPKKAAGPSVYQNMDY